jgi:thiosulfate dehydrogenase (quinone) large subunit
MSVHQQSRPEPGTATPTAGAHSSGAASATVTAKVLAALRIVTGAVFLWAFLDKTFGLGYATTSERAWINGGSPAGGYLRGVSAGPLESTFHSWAGSVWVDWLYMAGMLGLGIALLAGIGLRVAAAAGTAMMLLMWASQWPPAQHLSDGSPSMSPNPLIDQHIVYAGVMIALAVCAADRTWGLGRLWSRLSLVQRHTWLR